MLSLTSFVLVLGAVWAQNTGEGGNGPQLPVGQTFKQFEYPFYQEGKLKGMLMATEARGITLNRAETTDLKIEIYDATATKDAGTLTITSPKADLYVNEEKMRTKNTVLIDRSDMTATSQDCDFDLKTKKYVLRDKVKVVLKHFDFSLTPAAGPGATGSHATAPAGTPSAPHPLRNDDSLLTSPGSVSDTNSAPIPPSSSDTK